MVEMADMRLCDIFFNYKPTSRRYKLFNNMVLERDFWYKNSEAELAVALQKPNKNVAKNLVLAIGDGMDVTTTTG